MNTSKFLYKDLEISHIVKKSLRNSYINIDADAKITLKTPKLSNIAVLDILNGKEVWIRKKINQIMQHPVIKVNLEDEVLLFGKIYSIDSPQASALNLKLQKMKNTSTDNILKSYDFFYKNLAKEYISLRSEYFSKMMNLDYSDLKFRKMKRRWGSCSSKKVLTFNIELMKIKKELIDYVIVHELAHLKHMNHSRDFHSLVERYLPDAKIYVKELKNTKIRPF